MGELDDSGAVEVAGQPGGPEGSGTVLTLLQPMSPQRQALLSSRCYQLSEADCWDLSVDYTKIKRLGDEQDHKEVTGRKGCSRGHILECSRGREGGGDFCVLLSVSPNHL